MLNNVNAITSNHKPETDRKVECLNETFVTLLKCKVNSSSSKIPWPKLLYEFLNQYYYYKISTKLYVVKKNLPYNPVLPSNSYYPPVHETQIS